MRQIRNTVVAILVAGLGWPLQPRAEYNLSLPDFGDPSQQYLSTSDEHHLGLAVLQNLRNSGIIIEDVQLNEYLASVGQGIAAYADPSGNGFTFFWVGNPSINAFAAPGGYIGVHSGLLLATKSEDELAGVLAHEISHVSQRHIARAITDAQRMSVPFAAAMLASLLLGAAAGGDLGSAAMAGTLAASQQRQINFTRANEQEADRIGTQLLSRSGYDPDGMATFFARLERWSQGAAGQTPEFLRTHPFPRNRIADVQGRLNQPYRPRRSRDPLAYYLAKARIQVLTTRNTNALIKNFGSSLTAGEQVENIAARYGYALALKRAGRYGEAEREFDRLLKDYPDRLGFLVEAADNALAKGDQAQAWRIYEQAKRLYSDDFTLAMYYGQALTGFGDSRKAMNILQPHLRRRPNDASLFALYARAAQRTGDIGATHVALTQYYYLIGDLGMAIEQAQLGLKNPSTTTYEKAQLQARLRQLQEEQAAAER
jgi:predicted Zn-dependent protease